MLIVFLFLKRLKCLSGISFSISVKTSQNILNDGNTTPSCKHFLSELKWHQMWWLFNIQMYRVVLVIKRLKLGKQRGRGDPSVSCEEHAKWSERPLANQVCRNRLRRERLNGISCLCKEKLCCESERKPRDWRKTRDLAVKTVPKSLFGIDFGKKGKKWKHTDPERRGLFRDLVLCRLNPESVELWSPAERQEGRKRRQQRKGAFVLFFGGSC